MFVIRHLHFVIRTINHIPVSSNPKIASAPCPHPRAIGTHAPARNLRHAGRAASLESAFDRCFGTVVKNQRHPVAGGNFNQSARLFRSLELLRATNNSVQRVEQRALLINHQLGVTDDVDEQDMPELEYR